MTAKFKKQRELLEQESQRLSEELEQLHSSATSSDERREGSPFGKREEEATETLELEKRLMMENRLRQEIAALPGRRRDGRLRINSACAGQVLSPAPCGS